MKNEIVNGKKIKAVYYVVNYDGDEYRDGKAVIPSCEVTVENLVKYGERLIRDIAADDDYFHSMAFVGVDASVFEENEDAIIFDVTGNFYEVETGFSTSITITYTLEEGKKMFDPKALGYKFVIQDSEAGNIITGFNTLEEAEKELKKYEKEDQKNGTYVEGFYEIAERNSDGEYEEVLI